MDKNKSIDGLVSRRSKDVAPATADTKKPKTTTSSARVSRTKKTTVAKTSAVTRSTTVTKASTRTKTKSASTIAPATAKPVSVARKSSAKTAPVEATSTAEDFLSPTQVFDFDSDSGELKAATPATEPTSKRKSKKVKKPMSKKRKIITTIIIVFVLLLVGAGVWLVLWGNDIIAKITGGQGNVFDLVFTGETYEPLKTDANGRTNILAFGTSGYNMEGEEGDGTHDGAQLTDSIMVISLDQETGDVAMLSLPRDLKASPTCTATSKINEVYWCANMEGDNEQAGAEALMAEVGDILGVDFQYYAHINWGALVDIVDTLGGITITLDEGIYDYGYTGAVFEPGVEYTLNGEDALGLARARHGTTSGDFSRGASQQKILIGIKDKVFEKQLSITDLLSLASTLGDNLRTSFSIDEMKSLAHLSSELDFDTMRQVSLIEPVPLMTTDSINGISYVLPVGGVGYYSDIQEYVAKMFSSDPRSYENYTILVLNATDTPGLASTEQTTLEEAGYDHIYVDDAPEGDYVSGYTLYVLTDTAPGTKKLLEEKYGQSQGADALPEGVSAEYDFVLIVNTAETPRG